MLTGAEFHLIEGLGRDIKRIADALESIAKSSRQSSDAAEEAESHH